MPDRLALLRALRVPTPVDGLRAWLAHEPVPLTRLAHGWNLRDDEAGALLAAVDARRAGGIAFAPEHWRVLREATLTAVAAAHEREAEMPGIEGDRLRRIVAPALGIDAWADLLEELLREAALTRRGAFVALPTHKAELGKDERARWERMKPMLMAECFNPPRVRDLARATGSTEIAVRALLRRVARIGEVTLVAPDHFFLTDAVRAMAGMVSELIASHGVARAAEFRDRIGTGRKVAIQILEFYDRVGFTRRVRDDHVARRDNPWRTEGDGSESARAT
jgi:selenocysteine-specific elongation factor